MKIPQDLLYTKDHEWARVNDDTVTIGISDYAQSELGDVVFVELPEPGDATEQFQPCASIEAVKAVSDLYASVTGEITDINTALEDDPQIINQDCYGDGWILKIKMNDKKELEELMSPEEYKGHIG